MEDLLINIHNLDDTHVSDHHNFEDCSFERKEIFNERVYDKARDTYIQELKKYNNLSWIKRLFSRMPQEPVIEDFIMY